MMEILLGIVILLIAYVMGSIPFGLYVGRLWGKVDVRDHGSGNIGVSNVLRTLGPLPAVLVLALDAGKGALPVLLARTVMPDSTWWLATGVAAIIGHNWPILLQFKGGRGVATTIGVLLTLAPPVALALFILWVFTLAISRYISLSSVLAAVALPLLIFLFGFPTTYLALGILISIFVIYRHRPNIQRLLAGTEYKIGEKARNN